MWKAWKIFAGILIATHLMIIVEKHMIIINQKYHTSSHCYFSTTFTDFQWLFQAKCRLSRPTSNCITFQGKIWRLVLQTWAPLAACREPTGKLWQLCKVSYVFEHKTQYLLIHAPFTRIVVFWHMITYPQWFCKVKFVVIPPRLV